MKKFDPLPQDTPVSEFDDYVTGYRYYTSVQAHMAVQDVAHKLIATSFKEADVFLHAPRLILVFRQLLKDEYVLALIEDTLSSLFEEASCVDSAVTYSHVDFFRNVMLSARIRQKEIHDQSLRMGELKAVATDGLLPWNEGGDHDNVAIPSFSALDEA
jgi:hypothetical protein